MPYPAANPVGTIESLLDYARMVHPSPAVLCSSRLNHTSYSALYQPPPAPAPSAQRLRNGPCLVVKCRALLEVGRLVGLILDQGHDHAVQVEEEHDEMEAQLGERFLLVYVQLAENFRGVQKVGVVHNLLDVPAEKGDVEN